MSDTEYRNPPAFPLQHNMAWGGMSMRDWFAGQALTGIIASGPHDCSIRDLTDEAYQYADAMLESHKQ